MVETVDILSSVLDEESASLIKNHAGSAIKKITD